MSRIVLPLALLTTTLALTLPAGAATLTRTFVSAAGSDSNPCTITQPCATFATAYTATLPNGIVAALDPGKYGPVTITGPITINGNGWAAITAPAAGNGITINAGTTDTVTLTGLEIDGAGAGYNGIMANSVGNLTIGNCILQNFFYTGTRTTGNGIIIQPSSGTVNFTITNTTASNNGFAGIFYVPNGGTPIGNGVIDHVITDANEYGIAFNLLFTSGQAFATVANSTASNSINSGIYAAISSSTLKLSVDNVSLSGNLDGIQVAGTANVLLGRSVITGNSTGVVNGTSPNTVYTYRDNRINLNGTDVANNPLNTTFVQQ
jgi:hypothetical protein